MGIFIAGKMISRAMGGELLMVKITTYKNIPIKRSHHATYVHKSWEVNICSLFYTYLLYSKSNWLFSSLGLLTFEKTDPGLIQLVRFWLSVLAFLGVRVLYFSLSFSLKHPLRNPKSLLDIFKLNIRMCHWLSSFLEIWLNCVGIFWKVWEN